MFIRLAQNLNSVRSNISRT